jgi:hypothetical protein
MTEKQTMSDLSNQAQKLLVRFSKTVDVMKSAYSKNDKMTSVWADDLYAVEAVMSFLETIRDAPAQREGISGRFTPGDPVEVRKVGNAIDEIVIRAGDVHIEQMSADGWYMGVEASDGSHHQFWFGAKNRKSAVEFRHTETTPADENRTAPAHSGQKTDDEAYRYAKDLLVSFVNEHCDPVPEWRPNDDLIGVLTQMDNALTVVRSIKAGCDPLSPGETALHIAPEIVQDLDKEVGELRQEVLRLDSLVEEARTSLAQADKMLSEHIEKFHDYDYEPHQVPPELADLRNIEHHLMGSLILDEDIHPVSSTERNDQ